VITDEIDRIPHLRREHPLALALHVVETKAEAQSAFDAGADAVVSRGAPAELRARVRALLRRRYASPLLRVTIGPLRIDQEARLITLAGAPVGLTPREFDLLACLASDPGRVFTKQDLIRVCWAASEVDAHSRALATQIARLRRRLGSHGTMLVTVWSVGYVLSSSY